MDHYRMKLTLTRPMLGTVPFNKDLFGQFVAEQVTEERLIEEIATVPEAVEKATTGFHRVNGETSGQPFIYHYMVKGFFKEASQMLRRVPGTVILRKEMQAYRKIIDGLVFVEPDQIMLQLPTNEPLKFNERSIRVQTPQGERVALTRSEEAPAGTVLEFTVVTMLPAVNEAQLREWFDYGAYHGLGQWRNASYGTFSYDMVKA